MCKSKKSFVWGSGIKKALFLILLACLSLLVACNGKTDAKASDYTYEDPAVVSGEPVMGIHLDEGGAALSVAQENTTYKPGEIDKLNEARKAQKAEDEMKAAQLAKAEEQAKADALAKAQLEAQAAEAAKAEELRLAA
ncbi:MAG: hypothetical protein WCR70_04585, partial [Sphaerochaetaceae bacterium]